MFQLIGNILVSRELFSFHGHCDYEKCGGACCTGKGLGTPVTASDVNRLCEGTGLEPDQFMTLGDRPRMKCLDNGSCVLFKAGKCTCNEVKPLFCSLFPMVLQEGVPFSRLTLTPYDHCLFRDQEPLYLETMAPIITRMVDPGFSRALEEYLGREPGSLESW